MDGDAHDAQPQPEHPTQSGPLTLHCDRVRDGYECRLYGDGKLVAALTLTGPQYFLGAFPDSFDLAVDNAFLTERWWRVLPVRSLQDANPQSVTYAPARPGPFIYTTFPPRPPRQSLDSPRVSDTEQHAIASGAGHYAVVHTHLHDHPRDGWKLCHRHEHTHLDHRTTIDPHTDHEHDIPRRDGGGGDVPSAA